MPVEQVELPGGGEGGGYSFGYRDVATGEIVSAERAAEIRVADLMTRAASAPAALGMIIAEPSYAAPFYTLQGPGGALSYVAPWQAGDEAGKSWWGPDRAWSRVQSAAGGQMVRFGREDFGIAFSAPPVVQYGQEAPDTFGGFLLDTLSAASQGPLRVAAIAGAATMAAGYLAGAAASGAAPAAFDPLADFGPAYFAGAEPYIGAGAASSAGSLMPAAVPESAATLRDWGLREISPGYWAAPEITLQAPSLVDAVTKAVRPLTDGLTRAAAGAATSAVSRGAAGLFADEAPAEVLTPAPAGAGIAPLLILGAGALVLYMVAKKNAN